MSWPGKRCLMAAARINQTASDATVHGSGPQGRGFDFLHSQPPSIHATYSGLCHRNRHSGLRTAWMLMPRLA